jgi:hypothetical protein
MTIAGTVQNGVVILEGGPSLPDGTRVEVVVPAANEPKPTLHGLLKLAGTINDLPPDMAEQHDHYIHGTPRK